MEKWGDLGRFGGFQGTLGLDFFMKHFMAEEHCDIDRRVKDDDKSSRRHEQLKWL